MFKDEPKTSNDWFQLSLTSDTPQKAVLSYGGTEIASAECKIKYLLVALGEGPREFHDLSHNQYYFYDTHLPISSFYACIIADLLSTLSVFCMMDHRQKMLYDAWTTSDFLTRFNGGMCLIKKKLKDETPGGVMSLFKDFDDQRTLISYRNYQINVIYLDWEKELGIS
ncbi:hypothetical protein [Ruficoccus sp. ZRK36]|uniref:hypothetical protein n=1 Tax=Ruficoccus sp. ZRK36 TaxID=2866311 RepID=UPI001C733D75|nr:hypothetical protein [Ruficoccus sp. ZRK36]QYY37325.1 hypothetical protein K0V07_07520 [Ruficoccus sp. ZRK36]